jgi:hypothetical protein
VPGAGAALGYLATSQDADAPDGAGIVIVVGNRLATIDVQGGMTGAAALAAATSLAAQQAACLAPGATCDDVVLPPDLAAAT